MTKKYILVLGLFIICTLFALNVYTESISKQKKQEDKALTTQPAGTNFDPFKQLREEVANVAASALPVYLAKMPKEHINDFGFQSLEDTLKATLLPPIPTFQPNRDAKRLNLNDIEKSLDEQPVFWFVPIAVNDHIACLIHIHSDEGNQLKAVMFGDNYRANRIESGLRLLGWPKFNGWQNLRFLSFYEPTIDLLLNQEKKEQWKWINLRGTSSVSPIFLKEDEISQLLNIIKKTKVLDSNSN